MPDGILDLLGFAGAVVLAVPPALLGFVLLTDGDVLGGLALLAVAVGMVAIEEYVISARDVAGGLIQRAAGAAVEPPEDEE